MNVPYRSPPLCRCSDPASRAGAPEPPLAPAAAAATATATASVALADAATGIRKKDHFSLSSTFRSPPSTSHWQNQLAGSVQNAASGFRSWCRRGSEVGGVLAERPQLLHGMSSKVTPRQTFLAHPD